VLVLPLTSATRFVLVAPHYPENVGAAARAIKTMGITELYLVNPSRLARPEHEMAFKMAVRAWDVLEGARVVPNLADALRGADTAFATTARRGQSGLLNPREAAQKALTLSAQGRRVAVVLGNEKTGLNQQELALCHYRVRIPMAADQPSINLAQACQLLAYEWFTAALDEKRRDPHLAARAESTASADPDEGE
jgi:tRNA (cytidine32/uridine32-2'-O)-methyltransferase